MTPRSKTVLKWIGYPTFYFFALLVCLYLTLPTERAKARIVAEFNARQQDDNPLSLSIAELDTYWLSGVEVQGVELVGQPKPLEDGKLGKPERFEIDSARVRASLLSALVGTVSLSFDADAFGGTLEGSYLDEQETKQLKFEATDLGVQQLPFLQATTGIPMQGTLSGTTDLVLPGGKFAEADGTVELTIQGLRVGDGKTKIRDTIALPEINAGSLELKAEAKAGSLTIQELKCDGKDITVIAEGKIKLRDPFESSLAEMTIRYMFKDAYRNKNEMTGALLGKPDGPPGVLDLDPKVRRAKRPDGFYAWRLSGPLKSLKFDPASGVTAPRSGSRNLGNRLNRNRTR